MEASRKGTWFQRASKKCKKWHRKKRQRHGGRNKNTGTHESSESELSSNPPPPNSEISSEGIPPEAQDNKSTGDSKEVFPTTVGQ